MRYKDVLSDIKENKLQKIYLFYGKENYLKDTILKKITENSSESALNDFKYRIIYGENFLINEIIEEIQTTSFFSNEKTIIIKKAGKINKTDREKIIEFIEKWDCRNSPNRVIFIYDNEKPDKKLVDIVKKKGSVVNFELTDIRTLNIWIKAKFKKSNKKITEDALYYLKSMTDSNLSQIFNEIEKIDLYTEGKHLVQKEDILGAIGGSESLNIFKIMDDIGEKNLKSAMNGMVSLNNSSMHHLSVLAMVHRQIRLILQIKLFEEEKRDFQYIKQQLKLPEFIINKLIHQSQKYSFKEIFEAYNLLVLADLGLKDGNKNPSIVLEEMVMQIMGGDVTLKNKQRWME